MLATPDSFRSNQNPLGAVLLPQALATVGHLSSPKSLSLAWVELAFPSARTPCPGQLRLILADSRAVMRASMSCLLSLRPDIRTTCQVCTLPLILPVNQNPLVAYHHHQAPTATRQVTEPFSERFSGPDFRLYLTVLTSRGPHCSADVRTNPCADIKREQYRCVLWSARYPCLLRQVSASRSPTVQHRDPMGSLVFSGTDKPFGCS